MIVLFYLYKMHEVYFVSPLVALTTGVRKILKPYVVKV